MDIKNYRELRKMRKKRAGFTLVELMVAVGIIGLVLAMAIPNYLHSVTKGRDAKRRVDLKEMQTAVVLYYADHGSYPSTDNVWWGECPDYGSHGYEGADGYIPNLAPDYMNMLPKDPAWVGDGGCYLYNSNGTDYMILAHQTVESFDPDDGPDPMDRRALNQQSICVYSPGARMW